MANRHRGEVSLLIGGRRYLLRLTLGALAEMEEALAAGSLAGLGERLSSKSLRTSDLVGLLAAALRGGGADLSDQAVGALVEAGELSAVAAALARLFADNFGEAAPPNP
jgi:hypothetical protein